MPDAVTQGTLRTPSGRVLPLTATEVQARLRGPIAEVELRQRFENPTSEAIEAVYVFPLPARASVHHMEFRIRDRVVRAVVKEKGEARRSYEQARRQGRSATLLEQDEPSVFTLSVANVPPGAPIEVRLAYQEVLAYDDGEWRFVFPMVAPERYRSLAPGELPPSAASAQVPPPRVPTGERGADVDLVVEISPAGSMDAIEAVRCVSHRVDVEALGQDGQRVRLHQSDAIANRDFVLGFRAGQAGVRPLLGFEREPGEPGTFLLVVTPPADAAQPAPPAPGQMRPVSCGNCGGLVTDMSEVKELPGIGPVFPCSFCGAMLTPSAEGPVTRAKQPRDVVLLIDRSASMRGSMEQARRAVQALLAALAPGDAIQVFGFDHERSPFDGSGTGYVALAPEVAARVDAFLAELSPRGGTELEPALERAASLPARSGRTQTVVLITDAAVGNEGRLLRRAPELLGASRRLFVLALGPAVDRTLAARLARACGGAADSLTPGEDVEPVMARFARRVRAGGPILTGLSLTWEGAGVSQVYPSAIPDLFGGQPVELLGRYQGSGPSRLVLTAATVDGRPFRQELAVALPERSQASPGLTRLWARRRIEGLQDQLAVEPGQAASIRQESLDLALAHGLVSPYTSLVAEDSEVVSEGAPRKVEVPLAAPAGAAPAEPEPTLGEGGGFGAAGPLVGSPARSAPPRSRRARGPAPASSPGGPPPVPSAPTLAASFAAAPPPPAPMSAPAPVAPARKRMGGTLLGAVGAAMRRVTGLVDDAIGPEPASGAARIQISTELPGSDPYAPDELRWLEGRTSGALDLVFLVDETGSMGPYIGQVQQHLLSLVAALRASPLCRSLRLGLVTYRDHPPQDVTYASRAVALTDDIDAIEDAVQRLRAAGGGDGPESVTDGLFDLVRLDWRPEAARAVAWFGDAPPHGVEPDGDGFPAGCPCGQHWYTQAESCREMGIAVYAVGCLPGIAQFVGAEDVFRTVARTTRGSYLPLTHAELLVPLIAGAAATELDKQRIDAHLDEVLRTHAELLARTDEAERVRWLTEALRQRRVRPRGMDYDPDQPAPAPLRFRELEPADVEAGLARLRRDRRAAP
ncbi:VIT domain-containing protein [Haliangium sp.]|uniref:VIT domain-containing protein n=1 Tax=Haliangium sp. TaxID=2663208 RepID=UPI003D0B9316